MGVSKVNFGNQTLIDLTSDTVTAESLAEGVTAHGADGEPIRGTGTLGGDKFYSIEDTASNSIDNADYIPFYDTSGTQKTKILFSALKALIDTDTKDWASITGKPSTFPPSSHTHAWSEITGKPDTFAPSSHDHVRVQDAGDSTKFASFAFSKAGLNYGDYTWLAGWNGYELRAINKNQFAQASHTHTPGQIVLGNYGQSSGTDGMTASKIGRSASNKTFGLPAAAITIEYSTDGGSTWVDYGASNDTKRDLFNEIGTTLYLGKASAKANNSVNNRLRVTIEPTDRYVSVHGCYIWMSVNGNTVYYNMERSTIGAKDTFTTVFTGQRLDGWSGANIRYFDYGQFGGGSNQTGNKYKYRMTFYMTAINADYPSATIQDIRFIGDNVWNSPNNMVLRNHMYSWDRDFNVSFPAGLTVPGTLYLTRTQDASGGADQRPALVIGTVSGEHIEIDSNEVMAKSSGTATASLYLNTDGGTVYANLSPVGRVKGTITSGQVMISDGTDGGMKTSGYTIAKSVPSDAVFTDTKDWASITGKPSTFAPSTHTHAWADITGKPSTFTPATHTHAWSEITGKPSTFAPSSHTHLWADITDKPSTFAPSAHTHNNITSRGNVTCETTNTRPAVDGLSTSCAYSNGYPDTYGNVITIKGTGDSQLFLGWSGTSGAHAPVYYRSRRDTASANWSEWAKVYTSAFKPSKSDVGLGNVANIDQSKAIKAIARSGTTFTYTCLDGTTGTFTQQDNNTTYNFSGVTFYSGNKDNAEHNANNCLKNGHYYYTSNGPATSLGATTNDGALYVQSYSDIWVAQIAQDYRNGRLFVRAMKEGAWQNWAAVLDTAHPDTTRLPLAGGTMTGTVTFSKATTNAIAYAGTKATFNMIKFKDNTSDTYGNGLILGGGGLVVVGAGESSDSVAATRNASDEILDLASDGPVNIWTNVNSGATNAAVKKFVYDTSGNLSVPLMVKPKGVNSLLTGSATAAQDKGSGVSPRYFPTKWTFNAGFNPSDGDVIVIKMPNGGHDYGVFLSTNNGTNYYPVCLNGADRLTTHFGSGQMITLIYDSAAVTNSVFPLAGGDARVNVTGSWRVINYRDTNTDIRPAAYCETAAGTAAKVASWTNYNLLTNSYLLVTIVNTNTYAGALTLNINGKGAKTIVLNGSNTSSSNYNLTRGTYLVLYDGSKYHFRTDGFLPGFSIKNTNNQRLTPSYYMESTQTLSTSGTTTFTFSHSAITTNSLFDIYSSIWGVNPSSVTSAAGSLTVVFPKHTSAASLKVRVYMYWD